MTASQNGKSYFQISADGDPEKLEALTDGILKNVLETMQEAVMLLVNQKDTKRLRALQTCYNTLFKQAEQCMAEGKKMEISDDGETLQ